MNKKTFLSILAIVVFLAGAGCRSKTVVRKLANQSANVASKSETKKMDGVMYHLPKTVVQATVPVKKVTQTPGDFATFAPCFFSEREREGMVTEKKHSFSIDPPTFSSRGVPDTEETYVIKTKGKYFESKTLFVEYAPGYVLQKGEAESKDETLDFTVKALAAAASVAAKAAPLFFRTDEQSSNKELLDALREEYKCYELIGATLRTAAAAKSRVEEEVDKIVNSKPTSTTAANSSTTATPSPTATPTPTPATNPTPNIYLQTIEARDEYQKALALFKELKNLEEQRNHIFQSNGTNIPPETYKLMLEKNAEAIASYRATFLGLKSKEIWTAAFEFAPDNDNDYSELFFTYSRNYGVCNDGLIEKKSVRIGSGFEFSKPNPTDPNNPEKCNTTSEQNIEGLWIKVKKSASQSFLDDVRDANRESEREDKSRGWFYRVPADGEVTLLTASIPCDRNAQSAIYNCAPRSVAVTDGNITVTHASGNAETKRNDNKQIAFGEMQIAQLGVVASVPASTAGRSSVTAIMLDPATGAMKNYKSSSSALVDKSILDDAQKAANSTIDAVDPLNKKKRELEELKTQNLINAEKKTLANSAPVDDKDKEQ